MGNYPFENKLNFLFLMLQYALPNNCFLHMQVHTFSLFDTEVYKWIHADCILQCQRLEVNTLRWLDRLWLFYALPNNHTCKCILRYLFDINHTCKCILRYLFDIEICKCRHAILQCQRLEVNTMVWSDCIRTFLWADCMCHSQRMQVHIIVLGAQAYTLRQNPATLQQIKPTLKQIWTHSRPHTQKKSVAKSRE
mgnify:CR=1 FL=1